MAELQRVQTIRKFEIAVSKLDRLYIRVHSEFDDTKWIFPVQDKKYEIRDSSGLKKPVRTTGTIS